MLTYLFMGLNVHSNLLRLIRDRGREGWGGWVPIFYQRMTTKTINVRIGVVASGV